MPDFSLGALLAPPLSPWPMALALLVVFAAGVVRGFAGFGFSALCVAGLALLVSPARVVPAVFLLEILASVAMLRSVWRHVDRSWLWWLMAGNVICVPLGILLLAWLPEVQLRLLIGGVLFIIALLLRMGVTVTIHPGTGTRFGVGLVSGFVNGLTASGGLVVAVVMSVAHMPPAVLRATMVAWLLLIDIYCLAWSGLVTQVGQPPTPLMGSETLTWVVWMTPAMLLGIYGGQRYFQGVSVTRFRRVVLDLLVFVALLTVGRAVLGLWSN